MGEDGPQLYESWPERNLWECQERLRVTNAIQYKAGHNLFSHPDLEAGDWLLFTTDGLAICTDEAFTEIWANYGPEVTA